MDLGYENTGKDDQGLLSSSQGLRQANHTWHDDDDDDDNASLVVKRMLDKHTANQHDQIMVSLCNGLPQEK
jgi:hypothetical protein